MLDLTPAQELLDSLTNWYQTRNWDFYRFSSPLVALLIQIVSRLFKRKLAAAYDKKLSDLGLTDSGPREQFLYMTKDWDLKVSYFATMISAFFSIAAITRVFSGGLLFTIVMVLVFLPFLVIYTWITMAELGTLSVPPASAAADRGRFEAWLFRKKWSHADFYSRVLMGVNILLIILVFVSMPPKA